MTEDGRWRAVGVSMGIGATYDVAFAVAILGFLGPAAALLGLAVPEDPVYLRLNGIFLLMLAAIYAVAAAHPERGSAIVVVAAVGRAVGGVYFLSVFAGGGGDAFAALAVADLAFAVAHAVLLARARSGRSRRTDHA